MRLHSVADVMYLPGNLEELVQIVTEMQKTNTKFYLLSAGSNIVFAEQIHIPVINLMDFDDNIIFNEKNGTVLVGASVRIQKLIRALQHHNQGGIEYLYSVPSSLGGAIFMNAGRGRKFNKSISDYLLKVNYLDLNDLELKTLTKETNLFSYRYSPFQSMQAIILSATFRFKFQDADKTERLIKERIEHSHRSLHADKPSCGSIFCKANPILMRLLKGSKRGGAMFSKKTPNWICNMGGATASDVLALVNKAVKWHNFWRLTCRIEVRFFK